VSRNATDARILRHLELCWQYQVKIEYSIDAHKCNYPVHDSWVDAAAITLQLMGTARHNHATEAALGAALTTRRHVHSVVTGSRRIHVTLRGRWFILRITHFQVQTHVHLCPASVEAGGECYCRTRDVRCNEI
jgi:hypothetical protein